MAELDQRIKSSNFLLEGKANHVTVTERDIVVQCLRNQVTIMEELAYIKENLNPYRGEENA